MLICIFYTKTLGLEIPARKPRCFGQKIQLKKMANWRNCVQNWTTLLSLLVSYLELFIRSLANIKVMHFSNQRLLIYKMFYFRWCSLRTSESNYLQEAFSFYTAIRTRAYYSNASKQET